MPIKSLLFFKLSNEFYNYYFHEWLIPSIRKLRGLNKPMELNKAKCCLVQQQLLNISQSPWSLMWGCARSMMTTETHFRAPVGHLINLQMADKPHYYGVRQVWAFRRAVIKMFCMYLLIIFLCSKQQYCHPCSICHSHRR